MESSDKKRHLLEIIKDFDNAILVTQRADGGLRGRPMAVAHLDEDGTLYFATSLDSPKVDELTKKPDVAVTMQGSMKFASVTGRVTINRDRARIDAYWKESWKVYFPKGKDDPELCLLQVKPTEGEYWDNSGTNGVRYLIEAARAFVSGDKARADQDQAGHVKLDK